MRDNSIVADLESITGKIIRGDITPIVYDLVKDSRYIDLFVKDYLDYVSTSVKEEIKDNVCEQHDDSNTSENTNRGISLEGWLSDNGELISL